MTREPTAYLRLLAALQAAQKERPSRAAVVDGVIGWVAHERSVMFETTNTIRAELGRGPVSIDVVKAAERAAVGHIDFTAKWARYCANLINNDT